jgi:site-specific recombinase XerD
MSSGFLHAAGMPSYRSTRSTAHHPMDTADHYANLSITEESAGFNLHTTLVLMDGAYAPNTIRAIRADVERWLSYCQSEGVGFNDASSGRFARFIDSLTKSRALRASTIRRIISSVACCYRLQGLADLTKTPLSLLALRRMNRTLGRKMRQAKPIDNHLLECLLAACPGETLMALRNRLLLLVGHDTLLRRAELVSLQIEDIQIKGLSGHSLRVGAAQELARAGEAMPLIMTRGGWTNPDTVLRYIEQTALEPSDA